MKAALFSTTVIVDISMRPLWFNFTQSNLLQMEHKQLNNLRDLATAQYSGEEIVVLG